MFATVRKGTRRMCIGFFRNIFTMGVKRYTQPVSDSDDDIDNTSPLTPRGFLNLMKYYIYSCY